MKLEDPIKVTAFPVARGFSSIKEAIAHATSHPRLADAKADAAKLQGHRFLNACWTLFEWRLEFSGDCGMRIRIEDNEISWQLGPIVTPDDNGFQTVGAPPITLDWHKTIGHWIMDPSSLVRKRRGALFKDLFYSDHGLFLYLRGCPILHFGQAEMIIDGRHLIYVCDED